MIQTKSNSLLVRDVMSEDLNYASPDTKVHEIAETLRKGKRGSVLIKEDEEVVGIVTNSDIVNEFVVAGKEGKAKEILTEDLITVTPEMSIEDAAMIMIEEKVERVVVVEDGNILGVLSQDDIIKVEPNLYLDITQGHKLGIENVDIDPEEGEAGKCESCENYSENLKEVNGNLICRTCREEMDFA